MAVVPGNPGHNGHPGRDGRDGKDGKEREILHCKNSAFKNKKKSNKIYYLK